MRLHHAVLGSTVRRGATYDVREIEVYGTEGKNLAFQSSPIDRDGNDSDNPERTLAVDGDAATAWRSASSTSRSIEIWLREWVTVERLAVAWGPSYPLAYDLEDCQSGEQTLLVSERNGDGGFDVSTSRPSAPLVSGSSSSTTRRANSTCARSRSTHAAVNISLGRPTLASSNQPRRAWRSMAIGRPPGRVDPRATPSGSSSIWAPAVDIGRVETRWGSTFPVNFATSTDGSTLTPYFGTNQGTAASDDFDFSDTVARYLVLILPPSASGYETREIEVIR